MKSSFVERDMMAVSRLVPRTCYARCVAMYGHVLVNVSRHKNWAVTWNVLNRVTGANLEQTELLRIQFGPVLLVAVFPVMHIRALDVLQTPA